MRFCRCGHNQDRLGSESSAAAPVSFPREPLWGLWVSTLQLRTFPHVSSFQKFSLFVGLFLSHKEAIFFQEKRVLVDRHLLLGVLMFCAPLALSSFLGTASLRGHEFP